MVATHPQMNVSGLYQDTPRILIVDDEANNRQLLKRVFMRFADITEAENGPQTLDLLSCEVFDIVLLDIMMPGMNGVEVLKLIRTNPETADLPVILITALSQNEDMVQGLQLGANDYITKPFDIDVTCARVDAQLKMKKMMDVYKQSITQLETAQRMKDRLLRIASHDLKSPLANVRMAESLLRMYLNDNPNAIQILDTVETTVTHMNGVIEEFLDLAACQSGNIDIYLEDVPLETVILGVVAQFTLNALKKDIVVEVGHLPGIVIADSARLIQAFSNLVSNAIKYSPKHSTVTIWSEVAGDVARVYIADQGPGIQAAERDRLFTEFGKLSNRPTGGESSTGLGLWIVKHMIQLQNGAVGVDCPPDGGSVFWVELPARMA